jgi:flavorubredoxin
METRITEVADGIHQLTTYVPEADFSFNQYLVTGEEPLLFHTGGRQMFPLVTAAIERVMPVEQLRWISFGHVESDESGSMNQFLERAPQATVAQSVVGVMVSLNDLADRPPRALAGGEVLDIGGHRLRWIDTPHVPHGWETGVLFDETTRTLLCGDLFTRQGAYDAISDDDVVGPAIAAEDVFHASSLAPTSGATVRALADLGAERLALMHGPVFVGDTEAALHDLAADLDRRVAEATAA